MSGQAPFGYANPYSSVYSSQYQQIHGMGYPYQYPINPPQASAVAPRRRRTIRVGGDDGEELDLKRLASGTGDSVTLGAVEEEVIVANDQSISSDNADEKTPLNSIDDASHSSPALNEELPKTRNHIAGATLCYSSEVLRSFSELNKERPDTMPSLDHLSKTSSGGDCRSGRGGKGRNDRMARGKGGSGFGGWGRAPRNTVSEFYSEEVRVSDLSSQLSSLPLSVQCTISGLEGELASLKNRLKRMEEERDREAKQHDQERKSWIARIRVLEEENGLLKRVEGLEISQSMIPNQ